VATNRGSHGKRRPAAPEPGNEEAYRLLTIEPARAPEGCAGRDWLVYRIGQGENVITGYRQGELRAATAEVEKIIVGLNERRVASKGRPGPKPKDAAAAAPAKAAEPDEG
jgi:hypothetical protein